MLGRTQECLLMYEMSGEVAALLYTNKSMPKAVLKTKCLGKSIKINPENNIHG